MKKTQSKLFAAILCAAFLIAIATPAQAQVTSTRFVNALSNVVTVAHVTTNLVSADVNPINIVQGKGFSITPYFVGAASTNTGTVSLFWATTVDGTNYTTTATFSTTHAANGTTAARDTEIVAPSTLDNVKAFKLLTVTNPLVNIPSITLSNILVTFGN